MQHNGAVDYFLAMAYTLTIGRLHVVPYGSEKPPETCTCKEARDWCQPSFVFSIAGQVKFRTALRHLSNCQDVTCQTVGTEVINSIYAKLEWLFEEKCLLGCIHLQPVIYGESKIVMQQDEFPAVAKHLSLCPKESCGQLRRALLLTIRNNLRRN